jgi:hypothetical protein
MYRQNLMVDAADRYNRRMEEKDEGVTGKRERLLI